MKMLFTLLLCSLFVSPDTPKHPGAVSPKEILRCYGNTPCFACKNCSACKYCQAGGTCGVCAVSKKTKVKAAPSTPANAGQCRAITKKGTRCSRKARSNGYCWQHGG